jgi:hypothetical protein
MSRNPQWGPEAIPDQHDKVFLITGANSGLGFESALALAARGARVVLACRSLEKGEQARRSILDQHPQAALEVMPLDLSSLASLRDFAGAFLERYERLDVLMNNAGVMATPPLQTADGFELQFSVNHLGHFALTGLLLERLLAAPAGRVVTLSSPMAEAGRLDFDDLMRRRRYERWGAYSQSKLANLLFALELDRRLEARSAALLSVAAHPGFAATNLQKSGPALGGAGLTSFSMRLILPFAQAAQSGALPQLYAAAAPGVQGGEYYGPDGPGQLRGGPRKVQPMFNRAWQDPEIARRLWQVSQDLTGVRYLEDGGA